jgi:hypothetical protein
VGDTPGAITAATVVRADSSSRSRAAGTRTWAAVSRSSTRTGGEGRFGTRLAAVLCRFWDPAARGRDPRASFSGSQVNFNRAKCSKALTAQKRATDVSLDKPITALSVKPRSLLLPRLGGQGSGSMETGTFWGGYGGEQTPHRSPRRPLPPTPGHEPRSPGPGSPAAPSGAVGRSPKHSATPGGTPSGGGEPAASSEPSRASGQHRPAPQPAEPPHPHRVILRGGKQHRIRAWDLAVRSPDGSRKILRAIGADQHLRTSAPCRTVRLPRHVPDLPARKLPLKLAPTLTMPHGLSPHPRSTRPPRPCVPPSNAPRQLPPTPGHDAPPAAADRGVLAEAYRNSSVSSTRRARGE